MTIFKHFTSLLLLLLLSYSSTVQASHIYSMELSYRCLGNNQFLMQLEIYSDCQGISLPTQSNIECSSSCSGLLQFNLPLDTFYEVTPLCPSTISPCQGGFINVTGIEYFLYSDTISLSPCNDWLISTGMCCRSPNLTNVISNSSNYSSVQLDNSNGCNNSANVSAPLFIYAGSGHNHIHYPMAYDIDGDSLVYEIVNSKDSGIPISYLAGFSNSNPFGSNSSFSFNSDNGQFAYNAATAGYYSMGLDVKEYRNGQLINTSHRELVVAVHNFQNNNPEFSISNVQGAVLKDNIFYVGNANSISFDIVAVDSNALDSLVFNSSISNIGGSFSRSGSNPATASFQWNKTMPLLQEFTVEIDDNTCNLQGFQHFGFAILQTSCLPDSVTDIVAADSAYHILSACDTLTPYILSSITSPLTTTYGSLSIDAGQNAIVYQAGSAFQVQESFWVYYEANNGQIQDSLWLDITTVSCVWAGDTDTNKVVNQFDILPIGLGFGETGAARPNADLNYDCEPALNFANSTPVTGTNYKHADTDGNGLVDANDTAAIIQNWGLVHLKNGSNGSQNGIPFYVEYETAIPGQSLQIPIILGDSTVAADSIYGIAFSINYDQTLTDSNSVSVDFNTSWLGTINSDMIAVQKDFYNQGRIDVGLVRTDQINRSNIGQIATLNLTIKDDILKSTTQRLDLQISNVRIITNIETERIAATPMTDILISIASNKTNIEPEEIQSSVFPNPAKEQITVRSNAAIEQIQVFNLAGQLLIEKSGLNSRQTQLNTNKLPSGIYVLQLRTKQQTMLHKITIR